MKRTLSIASLLVVALLLSVNIAAQDFYFGADLSYVNEMNDCGVTYKVNGEEQECYSIFADHGCNLVRIRTWHTPSWYDNLNEGKRYSDHADIERSIARAKDAGMDVLLDFHLSDNWADPGKQVIPAAWADHVDDLEILEDSLYNYIHTSLQKLHAKDLTPEMVQIGNETNKGILQSQQDNDSGWKLDWDRNAPLFNAGIKAVRDFSDETGEDVKIMIHAADPGNTWLFDEFIQNGVTDFDVMGISYYWAWHQPEDIEDAGETVAYLQSRYPDYDVIIVETGYIWTYESNDEANNIINEVHPDYSPPSPQAQRDWLIDMTQEVMDNGATGVVYWEPAWVSSECFTQWGRGSHQEHATFFDFDNELMEDGGIAWMSHDYNVSTSTADEKADIEEVEMWIDTSSNILWVMMGDFGTNKRMEIRMFTIDGKQVLQEPCFLIDGRAQVEIDDVPGGMYVAVLMHGYETVATQKIFVND